MTNSLHLSLVLTGFLLSIQLLGQTTTQNNTLSGHVLYHKSGNKPAVGVYVMEDDSNNSYSADNGEYFLVFQTKRDGAALDIKISPDSKDGKKIELVNDTEVKAARLPDNAGGVLDIIVCNFGQRDIAAQKYYRILRTAADKELERKNEEVDNLLKQKEKDYRVISDLFAQLDRMRIDSAKIRKQAFSIANINTDRASQLVKDAVRKIDEEKDVEGALRILNAEALDTAYQSASKLKKEALNIAKKADSEIKQVIEGYEVKISLEEPRFHYVEIAKCYESIASIYEKEDYEKEKFAIYLSKSAIFWGLAGDFQKQLEFNLRTLAVQEKVLPIDHPDLATSYNNLALAYGNLGDYKMELRFEFDALAIREKVLPAYHADLAKSHHDMALTYINLGDRIKALESGLKALTIQEKILPAYHPDLASTYHYLAWTYSELGEHQKALEFNLKDLAICEKNLTIEHPDLARAYHAISWTYRNLGDYQKALEFNNKAIDIREKVLPANHPELARTYNNQAVIYGHFYDYQKQLKFHLKAFDIWEKVLPADHPDLAKSYHNQAVTYGNLGKYQKAMALHQKALAIFESKFPKDHPELANAYSNIGRAYRDLGDYEKAIEYGQKAIGIGEGSDTKHPRLNRFYAFIGITYVKARKLAEAQTALEKSESIKPEERLYQGWAIFYAVQNEKILSIKNLQKAAVLGFRDLKWLETEPDLKNIRKEKGYIDLVAQLKKQ